MGRPKPSKRDQRNQAGQPRCRDRQYQDLRASDELEGAAPSIDGERSGRPDEEICPTGKAMLDWFVRMRAGDTEDGSNE